MTGVERGLRIADIEGALGRLLVDLVDAGVVVACLVHLVLLRLKGQREHRQEIHVGMAVLHSSAIVALVFALWLLLIGHDQLVVFLQVKIAALALAALGGLGLNAIELLIELRAIDLELVELGLRRLA